MGESLAADLLALPSIRSRFLNDVLNGLRQTPKRISCKWFYDQRGSMLFDAISVQPEYYLTRTENEIVRRHVGEMCEAIGSRVMLIEYGSGSSTKTRHLLRHLKRPAVYAPVDISREHLLEAARGLRREFTDIEVLPVAADFTAKFELPDRKGLRRVVFFPGSTIGNFEPTGVVRVLHRIASVAGKAGGLLIGIDLVKERSVLERAYNDAAGANAEFNLNLLLRINRELGGTFELERFEHLAFYDPRMQRMDLRLVSNQAQQVRVGSHQFHFTAGEAIHTEYSHKYTIDRFARLAREAGFVLQNSWTDDAKYFGVLYFEVAS